MSGAAMATRHASGPDPSTGTAVGEGVAIADPETLEELEAELEQLEVDTPHVAIVAPHRDDLPILARAEAELHRRSIRSETRVLSAITDPRAVADYTENARRRGIQVIIAGAGPEARLPAAVTIHTRLPVIGVPLTTRGTQGEALGALLGARADEGAAPIAWVGLDDAVGAAVLAARIIGA